MFKGEARRLEREHNDRAWLGWHIAALMRAKKLPKLEDLMHRGRARSVKQTPEQMLGIVKMLNAAYGGRVISKAKH